MATGQMSEVIQHLRSALLREGAGLTDGQLLEDYISRRNEAALAALVRRHAPMVWGVCRRVLCNYHDVEDAFQATFLVLVRKGASITSRELLANWLYGVAHQTARKARATAAKRYERERQMTEMPETFATEQDVWPDMQPLLDKELSRLPDKYRAVIVLCNLEGKTRREAALQLGVPEGTIASRMATARTMLAKRLARHGMAVSGGALAAVLSEKMASAGMPTSVVSSTIRAATLMAARHGAVTGAISIRAAALAKGVLKTMLLTKLMFASVGLVVILTSVSAAGLVYKAQATQPPKEQARDKAASGPASSAQDLRRKAHRDLVLETCADQAAGKTGKNLRFDYFAPRFKKLVEENAEDFVGYDSLCWIVANSKLDGPEFAKALALLSRHHAKGGWASDLCRGFNAPRYFATASDAVERLLREIITTNPQPSARAEACFGLSQFLVNKSEFARVLRRPEAADLARRVGDCWGQEYLIQLEKVDPDKLHREASGLLLHGIATNPQYWANHATLGKRAPETKGKDLEGKFMALSDYRGKVVTLTFWAPWCVPCMAAIPEEQALVRRLAGQPFVMLGVAGDDDRGLAMKTVRDKHITWRSWPDADPERKGVLITSDWNVHGWGGSFILDHHGVIRYADLGEGMDFAIDALLIDLQASKGK